MQLAQSLHQEREEGVTYYKWDGTAGPSNDAYLIVQEAKANRHCYRI